jgi:hypothetical protein
MKTLFALVHNSNGAILKIVESAERKDNSILIVEQPNEQDFNSERDSEGKLLAKNSIIEGNSSSLLSIVKIEYNDENAIVEKAILEDSTEVILNKQFNNDLFWKLNNNGLKWVNNILVA